MPSFFFFFFFCRGGGGDEARGKRGYSVFLGIGCVLHFGLKKEGISQYTFEQYQYIDSGLDDFCMVLNYRAPCNYFLKKLIDKIWN